MSARDRDNLLDPRHPRSPYNKYNWDSPYSISNPISPNFSPQAAAISFLATLLFVGFIALLVVWKILAALLTGYFENYVFVVGFAALVAIYGGLYLCNRGRDYKKNPATKQELHDRWWWTHGVIPFFVVLILVLEMSCWIAGEGSMIWEFLKVVFHLHPYEV